MEKVTILIVISILIGCNQTPNTIIVESNDKLKLDTLKSKDSISLEISNNQSEITEILDTSDKSIKATHLTQLYNSLIFKRPF